MIVVRVEYLPGGDASRVEELGRFVIDNRSHLAPISDYSVVMTTKEKTRRWNVNQHTRADGIWELLRRVFDGAARRT